MGKHERSNLCLCSRKRRREGSLFVCLLPDGPAGDSVPGIARGVGLHIVSFGVNDHGGATIAEDRVVVVTERDIRVRHRCLGRSVRSHREILHIASMSAVRVLQSVLLAIGIEVPASRLEIGRITFRVLMDVNGVLARRQTFQIELDLDPLVGWLNGGHSDALSLSVL